MRAIAVTFELLKEGAHGGTTGSSVLKTVPFDRSGTPPRGIVVRLVVSPFGAMGSRRPGTDS